MALIVLTSASGSPGVTTSALGLALSWPRPCLLVEADPTGGSGILAGYFHGDVAHIGGLIDLALAHREGTLAEAIPLATMPIPDTSVQLLPGIRGHAQARSLIGLWEPLCGALQALERNGQDVIVDAGRLGLTGCPEPLIYGADLSLLVTRSTLPALSGARSWAQTLRGEFEQMGAASALGVLLVGEGEPYGAREVAKVLQVPVTASLALDQDAAAVFSRGAGPPRRFESSQLLRGLRAAASAIQSVVDANRASLGATPDVGSQR
jgi:hypothetical protein